MSKLRRHQPNRNRSRLRRLFLTTSAPCQSVQNGRDAMNVQRIALFGLILVVCSSKSLVAQESKSSSWWPFGSSAKSEPETRSSSFFGASAPKPKSSSTSMFKLPSWSRSKSRSKSTFSKMGSSTKKWMYNTADFLNPFNDGKPKASQSHGYQTDYWSERNKPKEEKSSMFGWMWKEEEEKPISSVNDFLKQPMPY